MGLLADLATVRRRLAKPDGKNELDPILQELLEEVSQGIKTETSRDIEATTYTAQLHHGTGAQYLQTKQFPILSVTAVTINGQAIPSAGGSPVVNGWRNDDNCLILQGYVFTRGRSNVAITYRAGYEVIPADLRGACVQTVLLRLAERGWVGYASKQLGNETVTFATGRYPRDAAAIIAQYCRVSP